MPSSTSRTSSSSLRSFSSRLTRLSPGLARKSSSFGDLVVNVADFFLDAGDSLLAVADRVLELDEIVRKLEDFLVNVADAILKLGGEVLTHGEKVRKREENVLDDRTRHGEAIDVPCRARSENIPPGRGAPGTPSLRRQRRSNCPSSTSGSKARVRPMANVGDARTKWCRPIKVTPRRLIASRGSSRSAPHRELRPRCESAAPVCCRRPFAAGRRRAAAHR